MLRRINRIVQDYLREKRLILGRKLWDRKQGEEKCSEGDIIESNKIKSILFLRYDGKIGDMVINTLMFREIKKQYPDIKIGVVTRGGATAVIQDNKYVDKIYKYDKKSSEITRLAKELSKEKYDLLIDFTELLRVNQMKFINLCDARINMGLEKEGWKLFDISYKKSEKNEHVTEIYREILQKLGIKNIDLQYDLQNNSENISKVTEYLQKIGEYKKLVILNPFAASKHRSLNSEKIQMILEIVLKEQGTKVILVSAKENRALISEYANKYAGRIFVPDFDKIMETAELIKRSDFVISPDTSIVHIATAYDKKMIAIYREDNPEDNNSILWGPNSKNAKVIYAKRNEARGEETDINNFEIEEFEKVYRQ